MDNILDNIANSLFNGLLPSDWRKLAPDTCKQLGSWMEHLQVTSGHLAQDINMDKKFIQISYA